MHKGQNLFRNIAYKRLHFVCFSEMTDVEKVGFRIKSRLFLPSLAHSKVAFGV